MQYNRILKGLFFALLFSNSLLAKNLSKDIYALSKTTYWHTLGHYKNNISQIDSKEFFLSKNGKFNPYLELKTTISNLINPLYKDNNSTYCKFPARRFWIEKKLPYLKIKKQICSNLDDELNQISSVNKITLSFPTSHINSPASMFGHTLLRLDDQNGDLLNSYAINYAAFTNESNGFLYAWNGLTGGYKGKYSIIPYYKKLNEYNNMENRDIWEYELNLTKEEIFKLKLHLFEVKHNWSKYYYFNNNCSYEILWLLQSARKNLKLTEKFNYKTLPIDTIKAINNAGLIKKYNYRSSSMKNILLVYNKINDKSLANKFFLNSDYSLLDNLTIKQKRYILNYSLEYLKYKKTQNLITKDNYLTRLLNFLKIRSTLGDDEKIISNNIPNPLSMHDTNKFTFQISEIGTNIKYKPTFHSIYDINNGFIQGAYIDFFKFDFNIDKKNKLTLNNFSIFDIKSYASRDDLFKPISWSVDLGNEKWKDANNYYKLKVASGFTYSYKNFLNSFLIISNIYSFNKTYLAYGLKYYFEYNLNSSKIVLDSSIEKYPSNIYNTMDIFYIYNVKKNLNIELGFKKNIYTKYNYFGLSYNF